MKVSPKCRTKIYVTPFWEVLTHFLIGKGPIKSGLGKSLPLCIKWPVDIMFIVDILSLIFLNMNIFS